MKDFVSQLKTFLRKNALLLVSTKIIKLVLLLLFFSSCTSNQEKPSTNAKSDSAKYEDAVLPGDSLIKDLESSDAEEQEEESDEFLEENTVIQQD